MARQRGLRHIVNTTIGAVMEKFEASMDRGLKLLAGIGLQATGAGLDDLIRDCLALLGPPHARRAGETLWAIFASALHR